MQIQFKGTNYELVSEMTDLATTKLEALQKYLGKDDRPVHVYVALGKVTEAHQTGEIWFTEINLDVEGKRHTVKATAETLRNAIDSAVGDLGRELKADKQKQENFFRRGGARLKELFRFGD